MESESNVARVAAIVRANRKTERTVYQRRDRCLAGGAAGLERDATRPERGPPLKGATIERVVAVRLNEKPRKGARQSLHKTAGAVGLSHSSARARSFQPSKGPDIRRYLKKRRAGAMTNNDKRRRARLRLRRSTAPGAGFSGERLSAIAVRNCCASCNAIGRNAAKSLDLHLAVDNYATHKHSKVKTWIKLHLRFTPASGPRINRLERFFGPLASGADRRHVPIARAASVRVNTFVLSRLSISQAIVKPPPAPNQAKSVRYPLNRAQSDRARRADQSRDRAFGFFICVDDIRYYFGLSRFSRNRRLEFTKKIEIPLRRAKYWHGLRACDFSVTRARGGIRGSKFA